MRPMRHIDPMAAGWLQERMVRCGRRGCRCARGHLHGPYVYLAYCLWDDRAGRWRTRRRYVKAEDVPEVRRLLHTAKSLDRAVMGVLRNQGAILAGLGRCQQHAKADAIPHLRGVIERWQRMIQSRKELP